MKKTVCFAITVGVALLTFSCTKNPDTPDTEAGNWVRRGTLDGPARSGAVSFVINDTAYIGTGFNQNVQTYKNEHGDDLIKNGFLRDFWKLNMPPVSEGNTQENYTWTQVEELPGPNGFRAYAVGFNIGNIGYVGTGMSADRYTMLKDFYAFDGTKWEQKADFPGSPRQYAVGFGFGSRGYITTGDDGANTQKDNYQYNPEDNSWRAVTALSGTKRQGASVFVHKNKAYVFGGYSSFDKVTDMWAMDSATLKWEYKGNLINELDDSRDDDYTDICRQYGSAFVIGDYGYYTAGDNRGILISSTWRYDFANNQWARRTPLERAARTKALGFSVHNRGFVGTGATGSQAMDDFQEFMPNQTVDAAD
ncbi:N-acetylneuraminic acid mutarotase [Filimonas zeae]|uniref:Galactose oxidase, central domain n=1 Tax=Filimonas zeae TaxID=1737353 RepID=A0A917J2P3_9BACT|nr:kelch repeat-containing protein [Filimonas zeae]MDR6342216.1 N-acetylneuraminic acid mutarotase [Filimonas zeae]GGH78648.1 hypothetical protein GCM10011379_46820 [Filimonas zeae]